MDHKHMEREVVEWIELGQDRVQWRETENTVMNHRVT